jgi:hypothetical protein
VVAAVLYIASLLAPDEAITHAALATFIVDSGKGQDHGFRITRLSKQLHTN